MDVNAVPTGTVVVGVDGSPDAERALRWAAEISASSSLVAKHG